MISIILFSSLVSLVTLGIMFIQRISPEKIRIPSYFLGVAGQRRLSQVRTKPPFWWEVLALLLFTAGAGLAYFSKTHNKPDGTAQGTGLVWFDPTISHIKTLRTSASAREFVSDSLRDLRLSEYVFIELGFLQGSGTESKYTYELKRVPAAGVENYIRTALSNPSVLSQPLDSRALLQALEKELAGNLAQTTLTLVTDAQAETVRPLSLLNSAFRSVTLIKTPSPETKSSTSRKTPLVPLELAAAWSSSSESGQDSVLGNPQLIKLDDALAAKIPRQARPSLYLEEIDYQDDQESAQPQPFAMISGEDTQNGEAQSSARANQPLLTTCTLSVAGPSELDGLSDLRAYAQFFSVPMRPMACRSTESSQSSKAADQGDPWKYRRASVWVVPVSEAVAGDLFQQGIFWTPEGFSPEHDALVYIADTRLAGVEELMESVSVQLEINQPSVRIPLLPQPPSNLTFPWELQAGQKPIQTKPIALTEAADAKIILKAADGTPLAFSLSQKPAVVYLRTGGAAPNGEFGRWGKWAGLWALLSAQLQNVSPTLTKVHLTSPQDWGRWFEEQKVLRNPQLRYFIDGQNLTAQIISNQSALKPVPALYIRERDDQMLLFEPPPSETNSAILTASEIEQLFPNRREVVKQSDRELATASQIQWLGALLALLSLIILWFLQLRRMQSSRASASLQLMMFVAAASLLCGREAHAQGVNRRPPFDSRTLRATENRPDVGTFPFRIGWCDASIPEPVKQRYRYLQNLLASRGTIDLPKELTAGACRLGASEIWWTSSLEALQAAAVTQHIRSGGLVIAEGISLRQPPEWMLASADSSIGLVWESPKRRGLLYRSFYLLSSFDGCTPERTLILTLRKKVNAQAPMGIITPVRFLTNTSEGEDCFVGDDDYRGRSFVNLMYGLLTTDYKEDQMQLPEILNRVRNLGLEP
ncbi:MAG: hypothetical protein RL189_117 [Pseudomonadota bacterium]|jgi:hypothetical protein